jgi:drug/metabolite transporter (DMT)-like permease
MVVLLALLAAVLFALAGAAEQRAAERVLRAGAGSGAPAGLAARVRRGATLIRSPLWAAGWAADVAGFAAQAGAVHAGSLSVVQPLLVTTLLFSLPLAAMGGRHGPRWPDWAGAAAACAGLALVLCGRRPDAGTASPHHARLLVMAVALAAAVAALVLVARGRTGAVRAVPLSVAAGMLFALGAAVTKLVSDSLGTRGIGGTAAYWPSYALIAVSLAGLVLQQAAFSAGSLPATMTAMTLTDPLVSYGLGVGGFGEPAPHTPGLIASSLAGLVLAGAGVALLARSPLLRRPAAATLASAGAGAVPSRAGAARTPPKRAALAAPPVPFVPLMPFVPFMPLVPQELAAGRAPRPGLPAACQAACAHDG